MSMALRQNKQALTKLFERCMFVDQPTNFLEWAEKNITLPRSHAFPGPYQWRDRTPYLWDISEAIMNPDYDYVVVWMPSQSGKTMLLLLWMLYTFIFDPKPFTFATPKKDMCRELSRNRLTELIHGYTGGDFLAMIDGGENADTYEKRINNTPLRFVWMSSATKVASFASPYIAIDEWDRVEDIKGEGDPGELLDARTTTYHDEKKVVKISSPLVDGESRIQKDFLDGTMQVAHKMCKNCGKWFEPRFELCWWPKGLRDDLDVRKEARVVCPNCAYKITNYELFSAPYKYIGEGQSFDYKQNKVVGSLRRTKIASFRVNGLLSGFNTVGRLCSRWWLADKSEEERMGKLQAVINTGFGEVWKVPGQQVDWESLNDKKLDYSRGTVPPNIVAIVSTADVHAFDLHYAFWAFDDKKNAYLIDWGMIHGDTRESKTWELVHPVLYHEYDGNMVSKSGIDCGYRTDYVKSFIKVYKKKYYPIIGRNSQTKPIVIEGDEIDERKERMGVKKRHLRMVKIKDDYWKEVVFQRLEYKGDDDKNMIYFPKDVDADFLSQVTGEKRVSENNVVTFKQVRKNHFLDCTKMAFAIAFDILKVGSKKKKRVL